MNRAQRRQRANLIHGTAADRQRAAVRRQEIHKCNEACIVQTVEKSAQRRRIVATAVAIALVVPVVVIVAIAYLSR